MNYTVFTYLTSFGYFYDDTTYNKTEKEFSIPFRRRQLDLFNTTERWLYSECQFWVIFTPRFDYFAYEIRLEIHEIIKLQLKI